jgi:TonB family protein
MTGIHYDNTLLKKSFLATCAVFLILLWVVFPSGDSGAGGKVQDEDISFRQFQPPPPKKQPKKRKVLVRKKAAVIPDPDPDEPEPTQMYAWESDDQNMENEESWTYDPEGRGPLFADGINVKKPECYVKILPIYPDLARKAKRKGVVILQVIWDTNGRIRSAKVMSSPGKQFGFDDAAINAVKKWKCYPATVGGRKVEIYGTVTVNFILN